MECGSGVEEVFGRIGGKITDPAGAYNYLEHHMVKNALPHFSQKHEYARKSQTPFSGPTLMLVRKKQAILKALALARGNTKFLERCRLSAEAREMQRQVKNAVRRERRAAAEALAEKAEVEPQQRYGSSTCQQLQPSV